MIIIPIEQRSAPMAASDCTNVTLLMLGIHCYHHLCNITSAIILVSPRLGLPGAWNSHVACLERTKQNKKGISAHNFHQVGEDFTSSHNDPRLSGPLRSCWGLKPVLWIEGNYLHWACVSNLASRELTLETPSLGRFPSFKSDFLSNIFGYIMLCPSHLYT